MGAPLPPATGSLVFPMEEEHHAALQAGPQPSDKSVTATAACEALRSLTRVTGAWAMQLLRDVRILKRTLLEEENRLDVALLGAGLCEIGYSVVARYSLGGSPQQPGGTAAAPGSCFRQLRHEFLYVRCEPPATGDYLVDPEFRQQFQVPQPTAAFRRVLDAIPEEYVGTPARLQSIVDVVCAEMAASFEARGLTVPPWRRPAAMMSKWLPVRAVSVDVNSAIGGVSPPRGQSPTGAATPLTAVAPAPLAAAALMRTSYGLDSVQGQSPDTRLKREAALQLETLARHNQREASPQNHVSVLQRDSSDGALRGPPTPPPTLAPFASAQLLAEPVTLIDEILARERGAAAPALLSRVSAPDLLLPQLTCTMGPLPGPPSADLRATTQPQHLAAQRVRQDSIAAALASIDPFARLSEPLFAADRRPPSQVSLLSAQLASNPGSPTASKATGAPTTLGAQPSRASSLQLMGMAGVLPPALTRTASDKATGIPGVVPLVVPPDGMEPAGQHAQHAQQAARRAPVTSVMQPTLCTKRSFGAGQPAIHKVRLAQH